MTRIIILLVGFLILFLGPAFSQEVVITGFPAGVAGSVGTDFFKPYYTQLQAVADTLRKYPLARAIITGGADGERYRRSNDAKNPALALGRAHALRNLLIQEFHVDTTQIAVRSEDVKAKGERYRYVSVRVTKVMVKLEARIDTVESRPPIEKHFTEIREVPSDFNERLALQLGAGFSTTPFGGMPILTSALVWDRTIFVEGLVGHTFWNGSFSFEGSYLDTKRRMVGGRVIIYPSKDFPIGVVAGWIRIEEVSQRYYKDVKLSEGPLLGVQASPYDFLSITAAYNPSKQHVAGDSRAESKNGRFILSVTIHSLFGGDK